MEHIPYKGAGPVLPDLMGGRIQLSFMNPVNVISHVNTGQLKAIAISGETRLPALPQVPTFTESGLPGFELRDWFGVFAPAGTPKEIIDKLSTELAKIMSTPDIKERLTSLGMAPFISTPGQFAALIKADIAKFAKIIKTANIKVTN